MFTPIRVQSESLGQPSNRGHRRLREIIAASTDVALTDG
jgi:hypothetical protein